MASNEWDESTRPCIICGKEMESAVASWETTQPDGGGEVIFMFSYGSRKFDEFCVGTEFRGVICDECAEKFISRMEGPGNCE